MSGIIKTMVEATETTTIYISPAEFSSAAGIPTFAAERVGDIFIVMIIVASIWLGRML